MNDTIATNSDLALLVAHSRADIEVQQAWQATGVIPIAYIGSVMDFQTSSTSVFSIEEFLSSRKVDALLGQLALTKSPEKIDDIEDELLTLSGRELPRLLSTARDHRAVLQVRESAVRIIAALDPYRARSLCLELAISPEPALRRAAIEGLLTLTPDPQIHEVIRGRAERDPDSVVRQVAADGMVI